MRADNSSASSSSSGVKKKKGKKKEEKKRKRKRRKKELEPRARALRVAVNGRPVRGYLGLVGSRVKN